MARPPLDRSRRVRSNPARIGVRMASAADDPVSQARIGAFLQSLSQMGDDRNVRIDTRWATTNADDLRRHAAELVALAPDVLVAATGTATMAPLVMATRTVPMATDDRNTRGSIGEGRARLAHRPCK